MKKTLLQRTIAMAKKTKIPKADICKQIGKTTRWYGMVLAGEIKNPGVNTIEALHDLLKNG